MDAFLTQYNSYRQEVENYLRRLFLEDRPYARLQEAMRYSLLAGEIGRAHV